VQQLTIGKIDRENECEKIRNAETGKPRKEKDDYCTLLGFLVKLTLGSNRARQEWEYSYVIAVKT
jgi:hypothetical protein